MDDTMTSRKYLLHDPPTDIGKPESTALVLEYQLFMVDPKQVEHGGVEIMDMDRVSDDVVTELACLAIDHAGLDSAAGHPTREAARMMVAPVISAGQFSL